MPKAYWHELDPNDIALGPVHLLLIDYDLTRFHSFDLFRWCLLDHDLFQHAMPELKKIVQLPEVADQVNFYRLNCVSFNPLDHFTTYKDQPGNDHAFLTQVLNQMYGHPMERITTTDLDYRMDAVFANRNLHVTLLKMKNDSHYPRFLDFVKNVDVVEWDSLFCPHDLAQYTIEHGINAVMCGSAELLLPYLVLLTSMNYRKPMQVFIGKYAYNYEWKQLNGTSFRMLGRTVEFAAMSERMKYSFATIDTYSGLTYHEAVTRTDQSKLQEREEKHGN